jgi:hypothetical protein
VQSAHWAQRGLQTLMIGFDEVINRYERFSVAGLAGRSLSAKLLVGIRCDRSGQGAGSEARWAGRCYAVGCEPGLLGGRPCDLPGCAARADP